MAKVVLEHVRKVFDGGVVAVEDFNLEIADREFVVLVGPSGCGKSTTLRMVAGLEEISGGTISIDGKVVNDIAPKDRDIAMVFQNYALYPHMSVFDNMAFGLKLRHMPKAEIMERVHEAADILGPSALASFRALTSGLLASAYNEPYITTAFSTTDSGNESAFASFIFKNIDDITPKAKGKLHKFGKFSFFK